MIERIKAFYKRIKLRRNLKTFKNEYEINKSSVINSLNFDIRQNSSIGKRIFIGENSMVECTLTFEKDTGLIRIGDRTYIGGGTQLISINKIEIGKDVTIAWGCTIYDHNSHSIYWNERKNDTLQSIRDYNETGNFIINKDWSNVKSAPIKICDKVWIGFDVVILKGVTIGEGAVVGARSVVTKDVPPYTVVGGNPAHILKKIDKE